MSFREWLIRLLGGSPRATDNDPVLPNVNRQQDDVPTTPSLPFTIRPNMINTLALSTDLLKVHLIDEDQLHSFKLATRNGVTIGLLDDQLAIVTPVSPGPGSVFTTGEEPATEIEKSNTLRLVLKEDSQYSLGYNEQTQVLSLIGAMDIISTINDPAPPTGKCELYLFDLGGGQTVSLRRSRDTLLVTTNTSSRKKSV